MLNSSLNTEYIPITTQCHLIKFSISDLVTLCILYTPFLVSSKLFNSLINMVH